MGSNEKGRSAESIAKDFFVYLGKNLPQQCASDEFYFLPRSEQALHHLHILDDLRPERIQDHIRYVKALITEASSLTTSGLEDEIDLVLLKHSMDNFIREFGEFRVWQNDPTLHIKIPLFAIDQTISQEGIPPDRLRENLLAIFSQIPPFLDQALKNLGTISGILLESAMNMAKDAISFFQSDMSAFINTEMTGDRELARHNRDISMALNRYRTGLTRLPLKQEFAIGSERMTRLLSEALLYPKTLGEVEDSAWNSYRKIEERLCSMADRINTGKGWKQIIDEKSRFSLTTRDMLELYRNEVNNLRHFFASNDILTLPHGEKVIVLETPSYLRSFRATASYRAPLTGSTNACGIFYIKPGEARSGAVVSHAPFLSAHETYPGHHPLDHMRIHHPNPIRRQIESPLFYEGWACYGETLVGELGYVRDPSQSLVQLQRQLWRSLRAILDIELQTGRTTLDLAADRIRKLGFSPESARQQAVHFALTPGYQLCYFTGLQEIKRLRERFASGTGLKIFHDTLLSIGEIPFYLVEKKFQEIMQSGQRL